MTSRQQLIGIELNGAGAHPAAWRRVDSRAEELFRPAYWVDAAAAADRAGLDFVFIPDAFAIQSGGSNTEQGRLDAVAVAARVATATDTIGILPEVTVTHTEPFHTSKAIATLDYATFGRAGWTVAVSRHEVDATLFGRKGVQDVDSLWHEAGEAVEVARRLWDSWEDDAEIRDRPTGRFIDRDKLHYIDFQGDNFSVKGPSITPRSPQGQPLVTVRVDGPQSRALAVRTADLIRIEAASVAEAVETRAGIAAEVAAQGRDPEQVRVLLDLEVHVGDSADDAIREVAQLDRWADHGAPTTLRHIGDASSLAQLLQQTGDAVDGVVLRPLALPATVSRLAALSLPDPGAPQTLRTKLGLSRPANRFALQH